MHFEVPDAAKDAIWKRVRAPYFTLIAWSFCLLLVATPPALSDDARESASLTPPGIEAGINLPNLLTRSDRALYQRIFAAQEKGAWRQADRLKRKLSNKILTGHLQAQRYLHPTRYRSKYSELKKWLGRYADHPDARRIYKLALRRKPAGHSAPRAPTYRTGGGWVETAASGPYRSPRKRSRTVRRRAAAMQSQIKRYVRASALKTGLKYLERRDVRRTLDPVEDGIARARIAEKYYYLGMYQPARRVGAKAAKAAGTYQPTAHWIAGLAAFRLGQLDDAAHEFEQMARAPGLSRWNRSAAAFWAARTNMLAGKPDRVSNWLELASGYPRTFYGLLAAELLGTEPEFRFTAPRVGADALKQLEGRRAVKRAIALLETGERRRAERELKGLVRQRNPDMLTALVAIAQQYHLSALALKAGSALEAGTNERFDGALYPLPAWRPGKGFRVDPALIFAFIRQESAFNSRAKSRVGARGLMQLMPATAGFMAGKRFRGSRRNQLYDPALNLDLGQKYVRYLLQHDLIGGNLLLAAVAYNGGPGNLSKWQRRTGWRKATSEGGDILLFIESLPARETRLFVERVLTNLWIYRKHLGQPAPSLEALAAGRAPIYQSVDDPTRTAQLGR